MSVEFDKGPPAKLAKHFAALPSYAPHKSWFWYDWGPVFYRGRLDGSAKLLGVASDPGPSEQIPRRTLVGDAGQRVQGFLAKLGLEQSYVLVNAYAYALHPSAGSKAKAMLAEQAHLDWRNELFELITGSKLEAIVAFGLQAKEAVRLWDTKPLQPFEVPHPSDHSAQHLLAGWKDALPKIRAVVTPDPGGDNTGPNYGSTFQESDYAPIPARDLPFGFPSFFGDDSWGRKSTPKRFDSVDRQGDDAVLWRVPPNQP